MQENAVMQVAVTGLSDEATDKQGQIDSHSGALPRVTVAEHQTQSLRANQSAAQETIEDVQLQVGAALLRAAIQTSLRKQRTETI